MRASAPRQNANDGTQRQRQSAREGPLPQRPPPVDARPRASGWLFAAAATGSSRGVRADSGSALRIRRPGDPGAPDDYSGAASDKGDDRYAGAPMTMKKRNYAGAADERRSSYAGVASATRKSLSECCAGAVAADEPSDAII